MIGTKTSSMTLSQRIILLVTITILVALFASTALIIPRLNNIFTEKLGSSAMSIAIVVANDKNIIHSLKSKPIELNELNDSIAITARATNTNIAMFTADKRLVAEYTTDKSLFNQQVNLAIEGYSNNLFELNVQSALFLSYSMMPIKDNEQVVGYVVVAFLDDPTTNLTRSTAMLVFLTNIIGLMVGLAGALFTAQSIKNVMMGLEPDEISKVMQEQAAILNSVREGVVATNRDCKITLLNDEAEKMLADSNMVLHGSYVGKDIGQFFAIANFHDTIEYGRARYNVMENIHGFTLLMNILPIIVNEQVVGTVTTFRKKNEVEELAEELTGVRNCADALRANTHEFMNKLHAIMGLVEIKAYDELRDYIKQLANYQQEEVSRITTMINNAVLSGFIIGKLNRAKELDIEFILTDDSYIAKDEIDTELTHKIILILGNLISNAYDVLSHSECEGKIVFLTIRSFENELLIILEDSGPGIPEEIRTQIFKKNFSTKGKNRGIGLHLVKETVAELGGNIEIDSVVDQGTIFTVKLNIQ